MHVNQNINNFSEIGGTKLPKQPVKDVELNDDKKKITISGDDKLDLVGKGKQETTGPVDSNGDGKIDEADFVEGADMRNDLNHDGKVDLADYKLYLDQQAGEAKVGIGGDTKTGTGTETEKRAANKPVDTNGDGKIDEADFVEGADMRNDLNHDGKVDVADYNVYVQRQAKKAEENKGGDKNTGTGTERVAE